MCLSYFTKCYNMSRTHGAVMHPVHRLGIYTGEALGTPLNRCSRCG
jgi:hypothetical protein